MDLLFTAGNDYEIQIRVKVDGVYSAASNAVRTNPFTPGAPRNLTATAGPGEGRVTLNWSAPSSDGGTLVTGWQYREKASGETVWQYWQDMSGSDRLSRSYSLPALPNPGDSVDFQVQAVNSSGTGVDSGAVGAAPLFRPRPVTDLAASVVLDQSTGSSDVQLNWSAPDDGPDIAKYQYQMRDWDADSRNIDWSNGSTSWRDIPGGASAREYTPPGLEQRRTYIFRVRAVSAEGRTSWAASNMAAETPRPLPGAPELRVGNGPGGNRVTLEWTKPSDATQGYEYRMKAGSGAYGAWTALPGGIRHEVGGLTNGTQYTFQVRAGNNVGSGLPSADASRTPRATVDPPLRINDLTATSQNGRVTFTWTVAEDGNNLPRFYEFYWYRPVLPASNPHWAACGPNGPDYIQCLQGVTSFHWDGFSGFRATYTDDLEHVQPRVVSIDDDGRMTMEFTTYDLINHFRTLYPYSIDSPGGEKYYPDGQERNFGLVAWYSRDGESFSDAWSNDLTLQVDTEARTLVSNRNQNTSPQVYWAVLNQDPGAQPFTTGPGRSGLNNVEITPTESTLPSDLVVTIRTEDAAGNPGDVHATLRTPQSYSQGVSATFTAPHGTILKGNTKYFVHFESSTDFPVKRTVDNKSTTEDASSQSGWQLDDAVFALDGIWAQGNSADAAISLRLYGNTTHESTPFNLADRGGYATNNPVFVEGGTGVPVGRRVVPGRRPRAPVGAPVAAVNPKGSPTGDSLTYTLKGADADSFRIDSDTGQIRTAPGVTYDAQVKGSYAVKVEATARQGASAEVDVTIRVVDEGGGVPAPADYVSPHAGGREPHRSEMDGSFRRADELRGRVVGGRRERLGGGGPGSQRHGYHLQPHRADGGHDLPLPGAGCERDRRGRARHNRHGPGGRDADD